MKIFFLVFYSYFFFSVSSFFVTDEDVRNVAVLNEACNTDYKSGDGYDDYGSSNSEIDIEDFEKKNSIVIQLLFFYK